LAITDKFVSHLREALADGSFVRLVLSSPTDPRAAVQRIVGRMVELQGAPHLAFTLREAQRDTHTNVPLHEAADWVAARLDRMMRGALLETSHGNWQLRAIDDDKKRLVRHKGQAGTTAPPPKRGHDAAKPTFLGEPARPWLQGLDLVDAEGRTRPNMADKLQQIDRYAELLAHLARDCGWDRAGADAPALRIVDVGCGKGHLTFAAWHLATASLGRAAAVVGVETRPELVAQAEALARRCHAEGLTFVAGDIATAPLDGADALVALHACNTATDHAIRRGLQLRAQLIVVAPCCHQEVRPQLTAPAAIAPALEHGLFAERLAEWVTDAVRTLTLEAAGYRVKAIEFVGTEHTGKNLLLAAVRRATPLSEAEREVARRRLADFRAAFGVTQHALDAATY
jgi:SAM-dependent methyltransferase